MNRNISILITVFLLGLTILLLPDNNEPVIKFNKKHGPSLQDMAGLLLMLSGWFVSCIVVIKKRNLIIKRTGRSTAYLLFILYLVSLSGVVLALALSLDWLLWSSVTVAVIINISFIVPVFRVKK